MRMQICMQMKPRSGSLKEGNEKSKGRVVMGGRGAYLRRLRVSFYRPTQVACRLSTQPIGYRPPLSFAASAAAAVVAAALSSAKFRCINFVKFCYVFFFLFRCFCCCFFCLRHCAGAFLWRLNLSPFCVDFCQIFVCVALMRPRRHRWAWPTISDAHTTTTTTITQHTTCALFRLQLQKIRKKYMNLFMYLIFSLSTLRFTHTRLLSFSLTCTLFRSVLCAQQN